MKQVGRIENEPDSVYFADGDKPAFGSTALRMYITDPEMFYHLYVAKDMPEPAFAQAAFGHALEEALLENRHNFMSSGYKSVCKAHSAIAAENPGKHVMTEPQVAALCSMIDAGLNDDAFMAAVSHGQAQVTYRYDAGPFFVQARVDLDVDLKDAPESIIRHYQASGEKRLFLDLKKTRTHYGRAGFRKAAMFDYQYPLQQELYRLTAARVLGIDPGEIAFRFQAISEDVPESRAYEFMDIYDTAGSKVADAIGSLISRYKLGDWDDFKQPCTKVLIDENYLKWAGE